MGRPPKDLVKFWYNQLKSNGFKDIEDEKQRLKQKDNRTQAFKEQEAIRIFFQDLDFYLSSQTDLIPMHREILELYSDGVFVTNIAKKVNRSRTRVKQIIAIHKGIIKGGHFPRN